MQISRLTNENIETTLVLGNVYKKYENDQFFLANYLQLKNEE